ncbi:tetratricopeptide repeat protein [Actinokineospora enzanensis]|uniref:tetratricopeptide repeat protein n=1 Tax=Actinokineospora enzanensis TaxID=155975 RepID=UPI00039DE0C5|nr:tetratricopeptide repeat protein [Actinokineospora enzanensis]
MSDSHLLLVGGRAFDRADAVRASTLPPPLTEPVSAHRNLRGPYTAAGTLLRLLVPDAQREQPDLVRDHEVELLSVAPELCDVVPASLRTLTMLAVPEERTRFYSRLRTLRIAHGLVEFIRDRLRVLGGGRSLVITDLHAADPTDRELVSVLVRRIDPALLTVVATTASMDSDHEQADTALAETARWCRVVPVDTIDRDPTSDQRTLAEHHIATDLTGDDPHALAAYTALSDEDRRILHDRRADEVEGGSWRWGALPLHRGRGADPLGAGAEAIAFALDDCMKLGFYDATVEWSQRGRAMVTATEHHDLWWIFTTKLPTSLSALGRAPEAEEICDEARANSVRTGIHLQCAYATAMLYTRHHDPDHRDHERALGWINQAIVISALLDDRQLRAFNTVFHNNGLALIEAHRGRPLVALDLVTAGITELDRELGADQHQLHRSVLRYNRAQVLTGLGRLEEAAADYRAVIATDPDYPEYHFDLGTVLRRLGDLDGAIAEYTQCTHLGPPFPEVFYNRADTLAEAGETIRAIADFEYVLDLEPERLDAHINLSALHLELGDPTAARAAATRGLAFHPAAPALVAALAQTHADEGDLTTARAEFDRALTADPDLVAALSGRAVVAHAQGDHVVALADLGHALGLRPEDPALLFNRAVVHEQVGDLTAAAADLSAADALAPEDPDIIAALRECERKLAAVT